MVRSSILVLALAGAVGCASAPDDVDSSGSAVKGGRGRAPQPSSQIEYVEGSPTVVPGNPQSCAEVVEYGAGLDALKVEPVKSGTYADGDFSVTLDAQEKNFSFTSTLPVSLVIVKGGPAAHVYELGGATSGENLVAPNGLGLSHLIFCWGGEGQHPPFEEQPPNEELPSQIK